MKQYVLFEESHVAILKQYWENVPELGPGDKALTPDNGVQRVTIDRIVEECGKTLYACHTDSVFPVTLYLTRDKLYRLDEFSKCMDAWGKIEENFFKISPEAIGIEKSIAYDVFLSRPWRGRRRGHAVFAVLSNGKVYKELFGEPAELEETNNPDERLEELASEFENWVQQRKCYCAKNENTDQTKYKDLYYNNGKYLSWDGLKYEIAM